MKAILLLSQSALLMLLSSCSTPPSSFLGTWTTREQAPLTLVLRGDGSGNLYRVFAYEQTLTLGGSRAPQAEGDLPALGLQEFNTNALGQAALVPGEQFGLLRWRKDGDNLILSERGGVETSLHVVRKTETTMTVQPTPLRRPQTPYRFRPGSLFDHLDSSTVAFRKSGDRDKYHSNRDP